MMKSNCIERLPEALRNSVRSGIILSNFTRVVEELVFNSLDAAATKILCISGGLEMQLVSVFTGVGRCYVKVVDDGSGITRDGLVLLGERYATSKLRSLVDMDAVDGPFGFRGEALASLSDISLLEICAKAYGCPNGYRKVMKGCKCLYLGIENDRKDVGTTVIVRDLFYNQPVRRKYMHSSPKKVLYDIKRCVLQIALVHPKVSFKVVDIESEEELLCTNSSSSSLSLLMSSFGIEDSSGLHELDASRGDLKLRGYLSGPYTGFAAKAFQYIYINSRFIFKGPIHKLLNQLATNFESLYPWKISNESLKGKRSRCQPCLSYILNITCPRSLYDLAFEPSKTSAEFKDWSPVLNFIEQTVQHLWRENMVYGESFNDATALLGKNGEWQKGDELAAEKEWADNSTIAKKKCRTHNHRYSPLLPSVPEEMLCKEYPDLWRLERNQSQTLDKDISEFNKLQSKIEFGGQTHNPVRSLEDSHNGISDGKSLCDTDHFLEKLDRDISEFNDQQTEMDFASQTNYPFHSWDDSHIEISDGRSICNKDRFLDYEFSVHSDERMVDVNINSKWNDEFPEVYEGVGPSGNVLCFNSPEFGNDWQDQETNKRTYLRQCSLKRSLPHNIVSFARDQDLKFPIESSKSRRKWESVSKVVDYSEVDLNNQNCDHFSRTLWHNEESEAKVFTGYMEDHDLSLEYEPRSKNSANSFLFHDERFCEVGDFTYGSVIENRIPPVGHRFGDSKWCSRTSQLLQPTDWDIENFPSNSKYEWELTCDRISRRQCAEEEVKDSRLDDIVLSDSPSLQNCTTVKTNSGTKDCANLYEDFHKTFQQNDLENLRSHDNSCMLSDMAEHLHPDSCGYNKLWVIKSSIQTEESFRRCQSAPPFSKQKKKFVPLNHHSITKAMESDTRRSPDFSVSEEYDVVKQTLQTSNTCQLSIEPSIADYSSPETRTKLIIPKDKEIQKGPTSGEDQDSPGSWTKWRNGCSQKRNGCSQTTENESNNIHDSTKVLDISSGYLHLAADSLVPRSINKESLQNAKVLQQVDKKFIPVVANGTLALIDQHAADERIQLEDLRRKVLSGEAKTVTYLDAEQELILPEIGYQLLQNYAEQIRDWGWICNIDDQQGSRSFKKNLTMLQRDPTVVTLIAVPCILGVKLSDVDLLEFLQQLADTDGSSTIPPSVIRVLNSKACRGAIMFGDSLLPSECALIVEELKQTSLCFQCAHGRPTTVPLVDLEPLHKHIAKLDLSNDHSNSSWHGLCQHRLSFQRALQRLSRAKG